ncbi:MAG: CoA-binding protein, partial [Desulfobacterales bacterium]
NMESPRLDPLFNPRSIALIGASTSPRKWGFIILLNILKGNYSGRIFPVNPKAESILGYPCYASVKDLPETVDLAIITTPAAVVPPLIDECGHMKIPFVVVITSDFSETGSEGAALERDVVARARKYGMRLVGPNSMGIFSSLTNLHAQMPPVMPLHGPVSMFSQSGNVGVQMLAWGAQEGVGFEKFVSSGNEGELTCVDYLRYFAADKRTRLILAYLEGIDPGSNFFSAARDISRKKPIVVFKGGRTTAGSRAAESHTGSLAGENKIFKAAFRQAGMMEVKTSQALMDCAKAFAHCPLPKGNRVGILTRGGGWGVITSDFCEENGLAVPPLPAPLIEKLDKLLPKYWSRSNPVDMVATIAYDPYLDCLEILAQWDGIDAIVALGAGRRAPDYTYDSEVQGTPQLMQAIEMATQYFEDRAKKPDWILQGINQLVSRTKKPIVVVAIGSEASHKSNLEDYRVVSYPTPERAARVLRQMHKYSYFLDSLTG